MEHILKNIILRGFDARIAEIQEEHHQQTTQLQQAIADGDKQIRAIWYENVGLQCEIWAKDQEIAALYQWSMQL